MPQIFSLQEKEKLRQQMLETGFELIKQHGMTHASVEKVTQATGLGRSTFYNFFPSKEKFIHEIICYQREKGENEFTRVLNGREKMTAAEGKSYLKFLFSSEDSIYQYLTTKDENKLKDALPEDYAVDIQKETEVLDRLLTFIDGVQETIDFEVVANLMKILALAAEVREVLHQSAIKRTQDALFELLFSFIFEPEK